MNRLMIGLALCALTGQVAAENAVSPFATGGDVIYTLNVGDGGVDYVHVFSNRTSAATFRNTSGKLLPVRYLAVGGGGAGGTTKEGDYAGGGGGGGGGVAEAEAELAADGEWSVRVGAGGTAATSYSSSDGSAGTTVISNGSEEVILVPGGGHGSHGSDISSVTAEPGAAGGGGGFRMSSSSGWRGFYGTNGTFASYTLLQRETQPHRGGTSSRVYTNETATGKYLMLLTGAGGGAGGDGVEPPNHYGSVSSTTCGTGGAGLPCDITGEVRYYGAGGGGGGLIHPTAIRYIPNNILFGGPGGLGGGGTGGTFEVAGETVTRIVATSGSSGTGSGGGGGLAQKEKTVSLKGGNGGSGLVVIRYQAITWNDPAATPAFGSIGAAGGVTLLVSGETETDGAGKIWLKPGKAAKLYARDAGGNLLSGWEDDETGEFIRGAGVVTVTPATRRSYTAVFGKPWTYDATAKTLTNGDWTFAVTKNAKSKLCVHACTQAAADGVLNLATPISDVNGAAFLPDYLGSGDETPFVVETLCPTIRIFLPEGVSLNAYCFRNDNDYSNATVRGSISLPRGITVGRSSFLGNACLTNLYFEGEADGGQKLIVNYGMFKYCSALTHIGPTPRTYVELGDAEFYSCKSLKALELPYVTKIGYSSFYGCSGLEKIAFSTNVVTFDAQAYTKSGPFDGVPADCRYCFPGKAPILECRGTAMVDQVEYPYTGVTNKAFFGRSSGVKLYGSWRADPAGWKKIRSEIGSADLSGKTLPELDPAAGDRSVKGSFSWAAKNNSTLPYTGWLIDTAMPDEPLPPGSLIFVR